MEIRERLRGGSRGMRLGRRLARERPGLRILFMSGYADAAPGATLPRSPGAPRGRASGAAARPPGPT